MPSPAEHDRRVAVALATAHVPRAQRIGRPSPTRELACRGCGRWTLLDPTPPGAALVRTRHHTDDGTPACGDWAT